MSEPTPNLNSGIQLAKNFDAERMRREREYLKQLIEAQEQLVKSEELLAIMKLEYANFLKQNPEIAVDIDQYFKNKKKLSQTEQSLEENLENLKNENKTPEEIEKEEERKDFEKMVIQIPKEKAMDLQAKRKQLWQLFKTENYEKEGLTTQEAEKIKSEFNTVWDKATTTGNYFEVEQFLDLVLAKGLKAGFAEYKKVNTLELMQRQITENNWEAFFIADFLKLFDKFILPKGANKDIWLKWVESQETQNSHQKQADLSEQINEQKIANQRLADRDEVENFRESLVKIEQKITNSESKNQELIFQDIPKSWEELEERVKNFLKNNDFVPKSTKNKFRGSKESFARGNYNDKIPNSIFIYAQRLSDWLENKINYVNLHLNFVDNQGSQCSTSFYTRNYKRKNGDFVKTYLELREFFAKFGLEF